MPVLNRVDQVMRHPIYPLVSEDDALLVAVFDLKKILDVDGILLPCRSNLSQTLKNLNFRIEQSLIFVIFVLRVRVGINA